MNNIFNQDFQDFINALNNTKVKYILVGGYSVILHGYSRNTGDLDLWVQKTKKNYNRLKHAFQEFGMPIYDMTESAFLSNPDLDVFTFGRPPISIDIMTAVKGLEFNLAFEEAEFREVEGLKIRLISYQDLITSKKAANRPKDINDIEQLSKE